VAPGLGLGDVWRNDVFLALALAEVHQREIVVGDEALDVLDERLADLAHRRGRGDEVAAVQQEPDHLVLGHQAGHVALHEDPVDGTDLKGDVIPQ
jgi:hypothetical protein